MDDSLKEVRKIGRRRTIDDVRQEFSNRGYTLTATHYQNNKTKVTYTCDKHTDRGEMAIRFVDLMNGHGCPHCANERLRVFRSKPRGPNKRKRDSLPQHSIENLRKYYASRGFTLLESKYVNSTTHMRHICAKHPDVEQRMNLAEFKRKTGCTLCAIENRSGTNHPHWKGGISPLSDYLRSCLTKWREEVIKLHGGRCYVTGEYGDVVDIHHVEPFYKLRDRVMEELQLPIFENISEYSREDLNSIVQKLIEYHEDYEGVPLLPEVHKMFHSIYGYDVGATELEEFKKQYIADRFEQREVG